ncbi:MAG: response regulator [Lachnospiraceae bacterium]|nr:response regulator [Lachnospiraceae bacterium]
MRKVLVVDDMQTVLEQAESLLKDKFEVRLALNTAEALKLVGEELPDIILCDINMPDTDGFALVEALKQNESFKEIPVIFMVIETSILTKTKAYELGVVDMLTKPFVPKELVRKLEANCKLKEIGWKPEY